MKQPKSERIRIPGAEASKPTDRRAAGFIPAVLGLQNEDGRSKPGPSQRHGRGKPARQSISLREIHPHHLPRRADDDLNPGRWPGLRECAPFGAQDKSLVRCSRSISECQGFLRPNGPAVLRPKGPLFLSPGHRPGLSGPGRRS